MLIVSRRRQLWTFAATPTALWLDGADASTVAASGGLADQWNDKSSNGRHVTATGTARFTYTLGGLNGLNVMTCNGTSNIMSNASAALQRGVSGTTIYAVVRPGANTATQKVILQTLTSALGSRGITYYEPSGGFAAAGRRTVSDGFQAQTGAAYSSAAKILVARFDYSAATLTLFENGVQTGTRAFQSSGTTDNDAGALYIGAASALAAFWNGIIGEIVITHAADSDALRQLGEGHLGHKWALNGDLASGHPFRFYPPYR